MLMNKKLLFGFHIFILMFSTALLLVYHIIFLASPFITIPGLEKEWMYVGLFGGYMIGVVILTFSIDGLWRMSTKVTLVKQDEKLG